MKMIIYPACQSNYIVCCNNRIHMTDGGDGKQSFNQFTSLQSVFPRRLLTGAGAASLLAIGANFCGITSFLLGFSPDAARTLKLDVLYPIGGYSRYVDTDEGFEFVYPESWLGDQTLLYRAAGKAERSLEPPPLSNGEGKPRKNVNEPVVAFGPPGSNGELNVSVIVSQVAVDFSIEAFGGPEEVGEAIVRRITGKRTDVKGSLIGSKLREDPLEKIKYYVLEFKIESPVFRRHNVAVCCVRKGRLYTLNAQAPESAWPRYKSQFFAIADSFKLV